jgi:hypothetical protein
MIGHEGRDEIIAVVVAGVAIELERDAGVRAGLLEELGSKLFFEERVGLADVDQQLADAGSVLDQRDGVMLLPCPAVGA